MLIHPRSASCSEKIKFHSIKFLNRRERRSNDSFQYDEHSTKYLVRFTAKNTIDGYDM